MSNLEKLLWLGVASYGVYSAGKAFVDQLNEVEQSGPDLIKVVVLVGVGAAFLVRFDSAAEQAKIVFS